MSSCVPGLALVGDLNSDTYTGYISQDMPAPSALVRSEAGDRGARIRAKCELGFSQAQGHHCCNLGVVRSQAAGCEALKCGSLS